MEQEMTDTYAPPKTMKTFFTVWVGQVVSMFGSGLTSFAIGLWLFTESRSVTALALNNVAFLVPWALLSPLAGSMADRRDRKMIMIVADTVQAAATLVIGIFVFTDFLASWHIYLAVAVGSAARAFQGPAWSASIALIVPKEQLGRASGLGGLGQAVARLGAPIAAGFLIGPIGLGGIIMIDMATFLIAVFTIILVRIPNPPRTTTSAEMEEKNVWQDFMFGIRYLWERRGLFNLTMMASLRNLFMNAAGVLLLPMVLLLASEEMVGIMSSIMMTGMLVGMAVMSAWGGPKKGRIPLMAVFMFLHGLTIVMIGLRPNLIVILGGAWLMMFTVAFVATLASPVYQTKIALDVQGRVFSTRTLLAVVLEPIGQLIVGPLADNWLVPAMASGGALAVLFAPIVGGTSPDRAMGVLFVVMGIATALLGVWGFLDPRIRNVETELPDVIPDEKPEKSVAEVTTA